MSFFDGAKHDPVALAHHALARTRKAIQQAVEAADLDPAILQQIPSDDALREPPEICVAGGFSAGKSSLVNALLGADLSPVDPRPSSARPTRFRSSGGGETSVRLRIGGIWRERTLVEYQMLMDKNTHLTPQQALERQNLDLAEIDHNCPALARLTLIDAPGFDDGQGDLDDAVTETWVGRAAAVVWVFDIHKGGMTNNEIERIRRFGGPRRLRFAVLTKADQMPPSDRVKVLWEFKASAGDLFEDVFLFSATLRKKQDAGLPIRQGVADALTLDLEDRLFAKVRRHGAELVAEHILGACRDVLGTCKAQVQAYEAKWLAQLAAISAANELLLRSADTAAENLAIRLPQQFDVWQKKFLREHAAGYLKVHTAFTDTRRFNVAERDRLHREFVLDTTERTLWDSMQPLMDVIAEETGRLEHDWTGSCDRLEREYPVDGEDDFFRKCTQPRLESARSDLEAVRTLAFARAQASAYAFLRSMFNCSQDAMAGVVGGTSKQREDWLAGDMCMDWQRDCLIGLLESDDEQPLSYVAARLRDPFDRVAQLLPEWKLLLDTDTRETFAELQAALDAAQTHD